MAAIALRNVCKTYGSSIKAVDSVTLDIPDAAFAVIVGPSGCGKTTLLRMLAGLERISEGEIEIGGKVVNDVGPAERDIAMVFQNYALYPHMSVYDNMAYGLRNRGTPEREVDDRVRHAAGILELATLLNRRPGQLSGGQRQRVAMGRAIVRKPKAFLFDEPLSNLDAKLRLQTRIEIRRLQRGLATTSVYVTHDQLEAMTLADLLVVMNAGRIEQAGAPLDLFERPATAFVATFLGAPAMNMLPVRRDAEGHTSLDDGTPILLPEPGKVPETGALVGIRPEDLVEGTGAGACFELEVDAVEALGSESFIYGRAGSQLLVLRGAARSNHAAGQKMQLFAAPERLHLFDRVSGRRIP